MIYKTKLFALEPLSPQNISPDYASWFMDSDVCQWNNHGKKPMTQDGALQYIKALEADSTQIVWGIFLNLEKQEVRTHIGNISLQRIDYINRTAEITFLIGTKSAWGKGVGFTAGMFILYHAFDILNLNRVYAGAVEKNYPMIRLAEKLGMKKESIKEQAFYRYGEYHNINEYVIFAYEWRKNFESLSEKFKVN